LEEEPGLIKNVKTVESCTERKESLNIDNTNNNTDKIENSMKEEVTKVKEAEN